MRKTNQQKRPGAEIEGVSGLEAIERYLRAQGVGGMATYAACAQVAGILQRFDENGNYRLGPFSEAGHGQHEPGASVLYAVSLAMNGTWQGLSACTVVDPEQAVRLASGTPEGVASHVRTEYLHAMIADRGALTSPVRRGERTLAWKDLDVSLGWGVLMERCSNRALNEGTVFASVFYRVISTWLDCVVDGDDENRARFNPILDLLAHGVVPLGRIAHDEEKLLVLAT